MKPLRVGSLLFFGGLLLSAPSCIKEGDDDSASDCKPGAKGCDCKSKDACNAGLSCDSSGKCVSGGGGQGGAGGKAVNAGRAGGSESFATGGSSARGGTSNAAGASGESSDAGSGGTGGSGGSGEVAGQSGEGASAGAGTGGGGHGGSSNEAGEGGMGASGGTGGSGGSAGVPACSTTTVITALSNIFVSDNFAPDDMTLRADITPNLGTGTLYGDSFYLDLYGALGSASTGTFNLAGGDADPVNCARCVSVVEEDDGGNEKYYAATEGLLTFADDSVQMYGYPHGTLRNVTLHEIDDQGTFLSGGACLTIGNADAIVNVAPPTPGWLSCIADYYSDSDCDCGCGAPDPACANPSVAACAYCYCNPDDVTDCTGVNSTQNSVCY